MKQLGKLEKVSPREIWADEARDFTPWLKENIWALSEALGLDLEITGSEGAVGDFWKKPRCRALNILAFA